MSPRHAVRGARPRGDVPRRHLEPLSRAGWPRRRKGEDMSGEIHVKKSTLLGIALALAGFGLVLLALQVPDIKREVRIWTM